MIATCEAGDVRVEAGVKALLMGIKLEPYENDIVTICQLE